MILTHEIEESYLGALVAQIHTTEAIEALREVDITAYSGHVVRVSLATLQDLVVNRGIGLSKQEVIQRLSRSFDGNNEAVNWILGMDFESGARANLLKLGGEVDRVHSAAEAEALIATVQVSPDNLDADLSGIMSRLSEILSRTSDDRYQIDTLEPYLREYEQGSPVIPPESANSIITFGVPDLDDPEDGIVASRSTLGVIAAPPGFGKSIQVSQLAVQTAIQAGRHVLVVSLEQNRRQVAMRSIASLRNDFKTSVKRGHSTTRFVPNIEFDAARRIHLLCPGSGTSWFRVEAAARRLHRQGKLDVLVLDYFTLLEPPQIGRQATSAAQYGWISKAAKRLAQELSISVILVAQFNRQQGNWDQEPEMKDLKETGQLEQDSDWLLFFWAPPKKDNLQPQFNPEDRVACYKKAKNRWGKMDFSGNPRYVEIDPAKDRIHPYIRTTDDTTSGMGGFCDKF